MAEKEAEEATGPELTVQGLSLPQLNSSVVSLVPSLAPMVADLTDDTESSRDTSFKQQTSAGFLWHNS